MRIARRPFIITSICAAALGLGFSETSRAEPSPTKRLEVGQIVPSFKMRTPKERHVYRLEDFASPKKPRRNKTKHPVLLDFFRTDCEPCLRSMPELVALHERYAKAGLKVVLVALHEEVDGRAKLNRYLAKAGLPLLVLEDPTDFVAQRYLGKTISLPATFLIDQDAKLVAAKYDAKTAMQDAFGAKIEALLSGGAK